MGSPLPATETARQLFLYGAGDGKRVLNTAKLAKLSGVHVETIRRNMPGWLKEAEEMLAGSSECGLGLKLSREVLDSNTKDLHFLRDQINQVKFELTQLETVTERLADWLDKFTGDELETALRIFNDWQRSCASKQALRTQFVALKKLWDEKSAIDGLRDVSLAREKEIAKGKARLDLKKSETETAPQDRTPGKFFVRRQALVDTETAGETVDE